MGRRTMVYHNHGYHDGEKHDKISEHCFVTNGVKFRRKDELNTAPKSSRRDLARGINGLSYFLHFLSIFDDLHVFVQ